MVPPMKFKEASRRKRVGRGFVVVMVVGRDLLSFGEKMEVSLLKVNGGEDEWRRR